MTPPELSTMFFDQPASSVDMPASFTPIPLPADLTNTHSVLGFQTFLRRGGLLEWQIGKRVLSTGHCITSRFVTAGGAQDLLSSPDPSDIDYKSLITAHLQRAISLMQKEMK